MSCANKDIGQIQTFTFPDEGKEIFLSHQASVSSYQGTLSRIHSLPRPAPAGIRCLLQVQLCRQQTAQLKQGNVLSMWQTHLNYGHSRGNYGQNHRRHKTGMQTILQLHSPVWDWKTTGLYFWPWNALTRFSWWVLQWLDSLGQLGTRHLQPQGNLQTLLLRTSLEWWLHPDTPHGQSTHHISVMGTTPQGDVNGLHEWALP